MGPPANVQSSELFRRLIELPRPMKALDYPRVDPSTAESVGQFVVWPLTQSEQVAAHAEADRFTKKLLREAQKAGEQNLGYDSVYSNEVAVQVLYRACRDASDPQKPMFPDTAKLRDNLIAEEVGALFALYMQVQVELGPVITQMSEEEMEAWVRALAEGGAHVPFPLLSSATQFRLLTFMASHLSSYWTDTSSAGLPPDEPLLEESAQENSA